jgi:chemotaxis-related protein WspD
MSESLSPLATIDDCWNRIGVCGDQSCPELPRFVHCHNCPVFATASDRLLAGPAPEGYLEEARARLAAPPDAVIPDAYSALVFRIGEEWLALPVQVLVEVHAVRPVHRIPHRGGLLAGLVNIRGELEMCARLGQLLAIAPSETAPMKPAPNGASPQSTTIAPTDTATTARLLVVQFESERWVFPVDEVDQVHRFHAADLTSVPATVGRYGGRMSRGIFTQEHRTIGFLDVARLRQALKTRAIA